MRLKPAWRWLAADDAVVPIVPALTDYQSDDFSQDLIAGAVVGMVTVPQAIAMPTSRLTTSRPVPCLCLC